MKLSDVFLKAAESIAAWEEDRSCVAVHEAATGLGGLSNYNPAHPAVAFYMEHVTDSHITCQLFDDAMMYDNGANIDADSQEAQDVRVLALLFAYQIARDLEKHTRGGWEVYPVPADAVGNIDERMDVIRGLVGSDCYDYKRIDGQFYVRRAD